MYMHCTMNIQSARILLVSLKCEISIVLSNYHQYCDSNIVLFNYPILIIPFEYDSHVRLDIFK